MIELTQGCFHMNCWCWHEFCYSCGAEYTNGIQTCQCVFWDEESIEASSAAHSTQACQPPSKGTRSRRELSWLSFRGSSQGVSTWVSLQASRRPAAPIHISLTP